MRKRSLMAALVVTSMLGGLLSGSVAAQDLSALYRITNGVSASHVEYLTLDQAERVRVGWGTPQSNASLSGKELSIGSKAFDQGMTLHAPAELVYRLDKKSRWLSFWTGINSEITEKGSVTVRSG